MRVQSGIVHFTKGDRTRNHNCTTTYKKGNIGLGSSTDHVGNVRLVAWGVEEGVSSLVGLKVGPSDFDRLSLRFPSIIGR